MKEWKRTIEKLELERHTLRTKLKDVTEENAKLQAKLAEGLHGGSEGEDSPDALSEIERQQELYNNISMKNKHIKRLLRDIDDLEKRNSFQVDTINGLQVSLNDATLNITALTHRYEELQARWSEQQELNSKLNEKLQQMEGELMGVCDEKEHLQEQLNTTRTEHTNQVAEWEDQIDQREKELNELKDRYDDLLSQFPGIDIEAERREYKLMAERLEQKDEIIVDLEQKILTLSKEIHRSTEVMNRISEEKVRASQEKRQESHCCQEYRMQLEKANERCREMQEILADVEDDNRVKSKQAVEAIEALRRYENGEEGLASALKKVHRLQEKVNSRDKQIRQLISEINLANEIAIENGVLRRQLAALAQNLKRQTNYSDMPDLDTGKTLPQSPGNGSVAGVDDLVASIDDVQAIKFCEKCMKQYNVYDSMKHCKACIFRHSFSYCDKCVGQLQMNFDEDRPNGASRSAEKDANHHRIRELEQQYITVIEENENLREGMHEILEKLREYDAMSDRLTIDRDTLEKLLAVLCVRPMSLGWHSGMRLPNDLLAAARERELLLKERLSIVVDADANGRISKSIQSTESVNDSGNVCNEDDNSESIERLEPEQIDFSEQVLLKAVEIDRLMEKNEQLRVENERLLAVQDELQVTQKLYTEMLHITNASENEKDRLLVQTVDRLRDIESGVCTLQRKVDFLKAENDNLHNSLRQIKSEHLNLLHELRLQLATRGSELKQPEAIDAVKGDSFDSLDSDQIEKLECELMRMKSEATNIYNIFLKNIREVDKDHLLEVDYSKLNQLSIVDNSLAVEFVTKDEYKRMKDRLDGLERELQRELVKSGHLEELLKVSNEQIRSQQSLISKYSEEEVSLRHLVVDLQSASNEKYLLARANKELELEEQRKYQHQMRDEEYERIFAKLKENLEGNHIQDKINLIKYESQSEYLTRQLILCQEQVDQLQRENKQLRMKEIDYTRHWDTLELLFGEEAQRSRQDRDKYFDKAVQVAVEAESRLTECQGRIKLLEKSLEEKESLLKEQAQSPSVAKHDRVEDSILSTTIGSLQNLLLEKDTTLSRYQELLKSERSEHSQVYDENMAQIRNLKKRIDDLEQKLYEKQKECDNIATQLNDMNRLKALQESVPEKPRSAEDEAATGSSDTGVIVYTDKIIENIYEIDEKKEREIQDLNVQVKMLERNVQELENEQKRLQLQLREANTREKKSEKMLREKEMELVSLNDRLTKETHDLREFTETIASAQEIEQLKEMLEEKDRHIQDLTETLSQFHEDQRSFMNDTSLHSAEQVSQLSADLNRSEASNRVLKTQIEALKRQIVSIQQREKQSRDLVKTLKNQLIKRPVIAMKADRMSTPREDQLARRVQQLETELLDTKDELRKQTAINENRRAKTAAELDLWNKQKRWQQMAERLKVQLKEREVELEKVKVHFNTAKTTIARLERDRTRLNSAGTGSGAPASLLDNKYQPSGSPDQYCSTDSTESEDTSTITTQMFTQNSKEIIEALKSRIESQQRRIIAMELDRKGSNTVAHELEKMQEKLCNMEAQNVRLEAKTLQLQLDNDMLRQSDESERLKRQIKHLEEYVIALKEEIAKATAGCPESINFENLCVRCSRRSGTNDLAERNANLEQTVLTLKRMIEKLRAENKHLKEHRNRERAASAESLANLSNETIAKELYDRLKKEHEKLQQNLTDALNKVSVQQVEIELLSSVTCTRCKVSAAAAGSGGPNRADPATGADEELRDKLEKKSQLLEKAKILLQRAAAKERYLKEQIDLLRRKCSDLQNVPVIDEISE
uniref:Uncharacterized protein n=1 Tax=Anopheles melas TaxID=34690 RepID=A0A182TE93_9DIPT